MLIPSVRRSFSFLLFFLLSISSTWRTATAQTLKNMEGAVSVFGQTTGTTNAQSFHPWLGYEVNYSYTRFTERFSTIPFGVQNNVHEVSVAYLLQGPTLPILGLQPFGAVGAGALIFLPTTVGGQKYNKQTRVPVLYEVGVNCPVITSHLGLRFQYRGLLYKAPDFNTPALTTNARRQTSELSLGAYLRF